MRLLLIWLLGVPLLVGTMVLARAALVPMQRGISDSTELAARACLREEELHGVAPAITQQRHRRACDRLSVE
jgi:hypothetical protein